ncbi:MULTISPECIES: amino acid ABC transporter permease [Roseobacteraceae]|jgi:polar amino acid transport system permease protein|uniref:Polar amino acid ABC transporter inner membrane subunit n=1 Tax=Celeribacter baekdonensis B30 TaxID=1208323 RepID=K2JNL1_9RHOB|nr:MULTISPECIES: amino acid ABC transporter permease [Roseobacteraceae]EKE72064.1 polar amino acid ABC transporter inner membrane subunit [Celeribacter baekdonensis B30]KAB6717367.1 amino acid ABC transporter permease [Roseobacter sp. TSBP12]|tara:strand:+ start:26452 stop:27105 length:654 start_codon:yes stop_codon:yes gene_type:complete
MTDVFTTLQWSDLIFLLEGAWKTIQISVVSILLGTLLGMVFGWLMSLNNKLITFAVMAVLDVFRSVPLLIQLILFDSFVAIAGFPLPAFWSGTIVLIIYTASLVAVVVHSGIDAVPPGLRAAARCLGMSYWQEMRHVTTPVGLRTAFPSWLGVALATIKDSALVSAIGYVELLRASQILNTRTQESVKIMLLVGLIYFIISYPLSRLGARYEQRQKS